MNFYSCLDFASLPWLEELTVNLHKKKLRDLEVRHDLGMRHELEKLYELEMMSDIHKPCELDV